MIKTDKFEKRFLSKFNQNFISFCVFQHFGNQNKLLLRNCVLSLNSVILKFIALEAIVLFH